MSKKNENTIKVIYTGRRLMGEKVFQRFEELETGKERFYKGVRRVYIGGIYWAASKSICTVPEFVEGSSIESKTEWEAADALVDAFKEKERSAKRIAKLEKPAIRAAIAALNELTKNLDYFDKGKLVTFLVDESLRQQGKKKGKK